MRPGQTASAASHKAGYDLPGRAADARRLLLLLWTCFGFITGGAVLEGIGAADLVSTSITGDGSVMSTSTWLSGDSIITGRIFGSGLTALSRETETRDAPSSRLQARSDGPLLIGEFLSAEQKSRDPPVTCVFGNQTGQKSSMTIGTSGILQKGNYSRMQTLQPGESYITAEGSGMLDLRHRLTGSESLSGRSLATGTISGTEHIRMDPGTSP